MSLLVFGHTGQVGLDVQRQLGPDAPFLFLGRDRADLTDPEACAEQIRKSRPAVVLNLAGITEVEDLELAQQVNGTAPGILAEACAEVRAPFVHLSTAEVFDGTGEAPWSPEDPARPVTDFGRTKFQGEEAIRAVGAAHVILRTSWVVSAHRDNLVRRVLQMASTRSTLEMPGSHISAPTPAYDLGRACLIAGERVIEDKSLSGTYHYQGQPTASLAEVAQEIVTQAGLPCEIFATGASGQNRRLSSTQTAAALGLRSPDWKRGIGFILNDLGMMRSQAAS